ncbi:hypothetical protein C2S51_022179 [Perilla frutescens var. frutescens]|nr:hypothetical protein C2S51_022179 [Perilla frutescens var. frutescens]
MASSKELSGRGAIREEEYKEASGFMERMGVGHEMLEAEYIVKDSFSKHVGGVVKVISMERGKISCILTVKPSILNGHGILFGGVVAAVAERAAIACGRTIHGEDGDLCLGEISISYLSSAPPNAKVVVDASVVRSGKTLTVVAVNFRLKESGRLAYVSRATLHRMPLSNL